MRFIKSSTLLLTVMFLLLPIISILMIHHITLSETLSNMDSGAFGKKYVLVAVDSVDASPEQIYDSGKNLNAAVAIYSDYTSEQDITIRSIYFNKYYVNLPMKSGRFFVAEDFNTSESYAVIGKGLEDMVYKRGTDSYIHVENIEFQVIGVLGYEKETIMDSYVFINSNIQNQVFQNRVYTLDFIKASDSKAVMEQFLTNLSEKNIEAHILTQGESFVNSFLPRAIYSRWFVVLLICDSICILLLSMEWINKQKKEICIRRLVGANHFDIIKWIVGKYFAMLLISMITGYLYCTFLYPAYHRFLLKGYLIFSLMAIAFLLITFHSTLQESIPEGIK